MNKAIREIPLSCRNHFEALTIPSQSERSVPRLPYSREEVISLVKAALLKDDEKRRIMLVLAVTGARLAEVVGLRKIDVNLTKGYVAFTHHSSRSLKTPQSSRQVPLLPLAQEALRKQLADSSTDYVFPNYADAEVTNSDSASATLNKWARQIAPGKSMHCLRHTLRDQLRAVLCPESISKEIGGWSANHDVSVQYGQGYPLSLKKEWLERAYAWLLPAIKAVP